LLFKVAVNRHLRYYIRVSTLALRVLTNCNNGLRAVK